MSIYLSRLRDTRIEEDSENSTFSKDLLVRNVFENSFEENMEHRAVTSLLASLVEECFRGFIRGATLRMTYQANMPADGGS